MPQPETPETDEILDPLFATMGDPIGSEPKIDPAPETPPPTEAEAAGDSGEKKEGDDASPAPPAKAADPEPQKVQVAKRQPITKQDLEEFVKKISPQPTNTPPPPIPPAQPAAQPKAPDPAPELSGLTPEQLDDYEIITWAEQNDPANWSGKAKEYLDSIKAVREYVSQRETEGDPVEDTSTDPEYLKFVAKNLKRPNPIELRRIDRQRTADTAAKAAQKQTAAEIAEAKRLAHLARVEPEIARDETAFAAEVEQELKTDDPFEADVYAEYIEGAKAWAKEYLRLAGGVVDPRESQNTEKLVNFVERACVKYQAAGKDLVRGGRMFTTITAFSSMGPEERAKHWTLTKPEILKELKAEMVAQAKKKLQEEEARALKRGFVRQKPSADPAKKQTAKNADTEDPKPISAPGVSTVSQPGTVFKTVKEPDDVDVLSSLGMS